ncbi:hypothetical protein CEE37_05080 [candidate division LCP-89 bacterium B3_LCP]|uniref:DUF2190 domain-containing protein n=1 Tax=candidate division LCP-89 bacterium B3_LCP TaxID=2012998 RepID=A0A532V1G3_UNCL8|nr:MAG: hypothetical protein CEE37_05080 [candidate division LCP-89 bacterium B3_LCP]
MSSQFIVDNQGVGMHPTLTMKVDTSTNKDFSQVDIDNNLTACIISDDNEVGMGTNGSKLFGKVVAVSSEVDGNGIPATCTVQAGGVARFKYNTGAAPSVNQMVEVDGAGKVRQASAAASIPAGGHVCRGQVIAKDTTNETVDVWLG